MPYTFFPVLSPLAGKRTQIYNMPHPTYTPPWFLKNGLSMTLYAAYWASRHWQKTAIAPEPPYREKIFTGAGGVPIFGLVAIPSNPRGTIIGTYGITGTVENQWFLQLLGRKAFARGYAVVLFDWRAHGKTAELSPTLTSDGLYEGEDFVRIAAEAKAMGCPPRFWFAAYSLGGQLALWGAKVSGELREDIAELGLQSADIGGAAVICPNLDSNRSLSYLVKAPLGKYLEKEIARNLKILAWQLHNAHPGTLDPEAIARANNIYGFDRELVIAPLGLPTVKIYYDITSPLHFLTHLQKPTLIIYAEDDPLFDPTIVPDLKQVCSANPAIDLISTRYGGHVGHISSSTSQQEAGDSDPWWAWNRVLEWVDGKIAVSSQRSAREQQNLYV